jgi:hypothetical protein
MDRLVSGIETAERFCPYLSPLGGKEQLSSAAAAEVVGSTLTRSIFYCCTTTVLFCIQFR